MILYHVTPSRNVSKVLRDGLIPKIGRLSKKWGEPKPAIYFFPDLATVSNGLENWMINQFGEDARLALLEVTIPPDITVHLDAAYERHVYEPIPGNLIKVLSRDILGADPSIFEGHQLRQWIILCEKLDDAFWDVKSTDEIVRILEAAGAEHFTFPGMPPIYRVGDEVVVWDGTDLYPQVKPVYQWIYDIDIFDYYPNYESEWNADFWRHPPTLYHATTPENAAIILRQGLEPGTATRGISNRSVGPAIFATTSREFAHSGSYGDAVIVIDTKRLAANRQRPFVAQEPDIVREELRFGLAHQIGLEDFEAESESGIDPDTVILYRRIAATYLSRDQAVQYTP